MIFPLLFLSAFAISFLLPLHYYPWASFYLEFSAFLALFIAAARLILRRGSFLAPRVYLVFFGFAAVALAQVVLGLSLFRGDGILSFFYVSAFALALVVSCLYAATDAGQRVTDSIALAIVLVGVVSVWVAMIQWLQLWSSLWIYDLRLGAKPYANLGQTNNYSTLVWVALFSLYYLFERKRVGWVGLFVAGAFLVAGAALSQSRTSWVVLSVLVVVAAIHGGLFKQSKWRRLALPLLAMIALYILSIEAVELKGYLFPVGGGIRQSLRLEFTDVRTDLWQSFIYSILEKPWFGFGWGQVSVAQFEAADLYPAIGLAEYSHNLLLDLLIWNGIPIGLLFFAAISYLWLRMFFYAYTEKGFYSLCCFTAILVHALLEYPHAYGYFLLLAGFFIGISSGDSISSAQFRSSRWLKSSLVATCDRWLTRPMAIPRYIFVSVVVVFAVSLVVAWRDYSVLEKDHRLMRFELASIGTLKAEKKAPDVVIFDQLRSSIWVARTNSFEGLTANEEELLEKVAARYPLPLPLFRLAQLRVAQGRPEDAAETLLVIKHLHGEESYNSAEKALSAFKVQSASGVGR